MTSWAVYSLPSHLEAVLAHELAHHLAMPRELSLLLYWLALPTRLMGRFIAFYLRLQVLSILATLVMGFLLLGVLGVWFFLGFSHYVGFVLAPFLAPFVSAWAARTQEKLADRVVVDLGYGVALAEFFTGREFGRS